MAYISPRTFFYPWLASALCSKPWLWFQWPQTFSTVPNHIRYKLNQLRPARSNLKQLLDTRRVLGNSSSSPAHEGLDGVTSNATARLCHCHTEAGSIRSSQVHSNKAAVKNSSRSVSFLRLYDACARVACGEKSQRKEKAARLHSRFESMLTKQRIVFHLKGGEKKVSAKAYFLTANSGTKQRGGF